MAQNLEDQIKDLSNQPTDKLRMTLHVNKELLGKLRPESSQRPGYEEFVAAIEAELSKR